MYRNLTIACLCLGLAVGCSEPTQEQKTAEPAAATAPAAVTPELTEQLRQLYGSYNTALLQKDGETAAQLLHSNIVDNYAEALQLAKTASRDELESIPPHKKLIMFYIRWGVPEEVIAKDDPHAIIAYMVEQGALRSNTSVSTDVRDFTLQDGEVIGHLYAQGKKTPLKISFAQEHGQWKIDLTDLNAMADDVYAQSAEMQKVSQDEALLNLVEGTTKKDVTDEIWVPLNERKSPEV